MPTISVSCKQKQSLRKMTQIGKSQHH